MKFTKEEAFEKLKGILTNNGKKTLRMSEKSINGQLETLIELVADDEMELDAFIGKVKKTFETMNSNMEKDSSDFVKEWEKSHADDNHEEPKAKGNSNDGNHDGANPYEERIAKLEKQLADQAKARTIGDKRKALKDAMKKKGIDDSEWSEMMLSEISIDEELDVDTKAESLLKIYNKQKAQFDDSFTPHTPSGGDNRDKDPFADIRKLRESESKAREEIV